MDAAELRAMQAPIKERYKADPSAAVITLKAKGEVGGEGLTCKLETGRALAVAGLHPATGGAGRLRRRHAEIRRHRRRSPAEERAGAG